MYTPKPINLARRVNVLLIILCLTISCVPIGKLKYVNDIDELKEPIINPVVHKLILPNDRLSVQVFSVDEKTNQLLKSGSSANMPGSVAPDVSSFLVDETGNIDYPFVGKINLGGLTTEQACSKLSKALSEYVSLSSVSIKFTEGSVTVMGEVGTQGLYTFSKDKLTIYDALALGRGISRYGDRKNVILIRQEGDKIMHHKLDLSNSNIASKEYYYVLSNDIIIVEPLKSSSWYNYNNSNFATITSSLTIFIAVFSLLLRN